MGSWSVYCGISKIAITDNQECVLLILKKNTKGIGYNKYCVATLPIFGTYDDYGGIDNIIKDDNTQLIEEHFNCTIEDFAYYFTRGCIDKSDVKEELLNNSEIKDWTFMFIDKKVYDFMSTNVEYGYGGKGYFDFGDKEFLKLLGFEFIEEDKTLGRYKYKWKYKNKYFLSDGTYLNTIDGKSIHQFSKTDYGNLSKIIRIPKDKKWLGEKTYWQLWEYIENSEIKNNLFYPLGERQDTEMLDIMLHIIKEKKENNIELSDYLKEYDEKNRLENLNISQKYIKNYKKYGKLLCDLRTIIYNFYPISISFEPFVHYLTPQCGEYKKHQKILKKFTEINKTYIKND